MWDERETEGCGIVGDVRKPPMRRGMKDHVLDLRSWKVWRRVVREKRTTKIMAAVLEGW
jgi:hypothetical protein